MEEKYKELLDELEEKYNDLIEIYPDKFELVIFAHEVTEISKKYDKLKQSR